MYCWNEKLLLNINPYPSKNGKDNNWHWLSLNEGKIS